MKGSLLMFLGFYLAVPAFAQVNGLPQTKLNARLDTTIVKSLFFTGLQDKLSENYVKAAESFNKILVMDPDNAAVYFELATVNYRQNKMQEAELAIKKATELERNNVWYWKFLVEMYKRKGDMNALITVFNELIRLDPNNDSYYYDRSNAWLLADKPEEAAKGYDELEKKFGPSQELTTARQRMTGRSDSEVKKLSKGDALEELKKAKASEPDNFEVDLALADAYKAQKNSVEANAALQKAFVNAAMPTEQKIKIIMMLFTGTKNVQRMNDARGLAEIAVKTHPDDAAIKGVYAEVLYQQGDLQGALKEFQGVLKITEQLYKAWEQTLNIQIKLGAFKEAIKTADQALALYPNQGIIYYYLALAFKGNGQKNEALEQIKAALQLDPENAVYKELYEGLK
jgi:tetratricopeptide (TPR) repeat protein